MGRPCPTKAHQAETVYASNETNTCRNLDSEETRVVDISLRPPPLCSTTGIRKPTPSVRRSLPESTHTLRIWARFAESLHRILIRDLIPSLQTPLTTVTPNLLRLRFLRSPRSFIVAWDLTCSHRTEIEKTRRHIQPSHGSLETNPGNKPSRAAVKRKETRRLQT